MRKTIVPALALLTLCLAAIIPQPAAAKTALGTSKWSFEIGTDLGSGSNDVSFAIRRHSGASSAFRLSIQADFSDSDGDGVISPPPTDATLSSYSNSQVYSIQWMRFAAIRDNVTATFAVGPVVELSRSGSRQEYEFGLPTYVSNENWTKQTRYGLDLGLGVEWFFNPRFSLGGQSGLRGTTGTGNLVQLSRVGTGATYSKQEFSMDSDVTRITTSTARIQLTAYF